MVKCTQLARGKTSTPMKTGAKHACIQMKPLANKMTHNGAGHEVPGEAVRRDKSG